MPGGNPIPRFVADTHMTLVTAYYFYFGVHTHFLLTVCHPGRFQQLELKHVEDRGCSSALEFR